jgi:nucleolar MIF4G domain-containing protein 1
VLNDLRNNRAKGCGSSDPLVGRLRKWREHFVKKNGGGLGLKLNCAWDDVVEGRLTGAWWEGGASIRRKEIGGGGGGEDAGNEAEHEGKLVKLAHKLHMNTDFKRAVFSAVATGQDFMHAFMVLDNLPFKEGATREMVKIIMTISSAEKSWNPYYGLLICKLCDTKQSHRFCLKIAFYDFFKALQVVATCKCMSFPL